MKRLLLSILLLCLSMLVGCGGGSSSSNPPPPPPPVTLNSIAVTPATASVAVKATQQFTATGSYSDGTTKVLSATATWQSSAGTIATINTTGLASGVAAGTANITASVGTVTSPAAVLTVTNPLVSIAVTPATVSMAAGFKQQFTATGTYADGSTANLTTTATWVSSNTSFATISNVPPQGLATTVAPGITQITAAVGSITSLPATLTVTNASLVSIAVTPANITIPFLVPQQFTATGTFDDNTTQDISNSAAWTSSDLTKVTILPNVGTATGVALTTSPVTITATKNGISASTTVSVDAADVVSIAVTPNTPNSLVLAEGTSRLYFATATLNNGSTVNITSQATWTSSDTTIASVGGHTGLVKANASVPNSSNPVTITVTFGPISQVVSLNVTNATVTSITVTPITATTPVGVPQRFTATGTFTDSTTQDISMDTSWTSGNPSVATVNNIGIASALSPGLANITAMFEGVLSPAAQFNVSGATLVSINVSPAQTILAPGSKVNFQAAGTYSDGTLQYLGAPQWAACVSTPPPSCVVSTSVSISQGGVATGLQAGVATVAATYQGVTSNAASVLVTSSPLVSITVTPSTASVPEAVAVPFVATGTFADNSTQTLTGNVTWASNPPSIATVSNVPGQQGFATGVASGQAAITAAFASVVSNPPAMLTVTTATITSISFQPSNPIVTHGATVAFTAIATFSDNSTVNVTSQVSWSSSNATVATISSAGLASTATAGTAVITATFNQNGVQVSGTTNLTVQ